MALRNAIINRIPHRDWLWRIWDARIPLQLRFRAVIHGREYEEVLFTDIFEHNKWIDDESRSGTGSNLRQTAVIREALAELLEEMKIGRLLDLPCGDFVWMKGVRLPPSLDYIGGEIVEALVTGNNCRYGTDHISFRKLNILSDQLPKADLVLCRDCLVHFSYSDCFKAIRNIRRSGSIYLLATHFSGNRPNRDIRTGQWRPISLTNPPFNFPAPVQIISEQCTEIGGRFADKSLALWDVSDIPS